MWKLSSLSTPFRLIIYDQGSAHIATFSMCASLSVRSLENAPFGTISGPKGGNIISPGREKL